MKKYIFSALALLVSLSACHKDGGYQRAPQPSEESIEAYFLSSNASEYIIDDDRRSITLKVGRIDSDFEASVPIIVSYSDEPFQIPSTVEFAAGEDTAEITIDFPDIPTVKEQSFIIRLADEYVNPYTLHDGSDVFCCKVVVSQWKRIAVDAQFWFYEPDFCTYSDVYWLEGFNRFFIDNFLESGVDLGFSIVCDTEFDPEDSSTWTGEFSPLDHYQEEELIYDCKNWTLRDDTGEYCCWKPSEASYTINGLYVFRTSYYSSLTMSGTESDTYRGGLTTWVSTEGDTGSGYVHIYMYWDPVNIKPADTEE